MGLDLISVPLSVLGFGGLVMGLNGIGASDAAIPAVPAFVVGVIALVLFVLRQRSLQREDRALLDLRPFTYRVYTISLGLMIVSFGGLFGMIILLPIYLQSVQGHSTLTTGLVMLPGGLIMGLLSPFVGRLYDRHGARVLVIPGTILLSLGMFTLSRLALETPLWTVVMAHVIISCGLALLITPLMTSALGSLPQPLYSHGSALLNTLQQVAGAAGGALFITLMSVGTLAAVRGGESELEATAHGVHVAFLVGFGIALVALALSFVVPRKPASPAGRQTLD